MGAGRRARLCSGPKWELRKSGPGPGSGGEMQRRDVAVRCLSGEIHRTWWSFGPGR